MLMVGLVVNTFFCQHLIVKMNYNSTIFTGMAKNINSMRQQKASLAMHRKIH